MPKILEFVNRAYGKVHSEVQRFNGSALLSFFRLRPKSGSVFDRKNVRCGPNHVHAHVQRSDGSWENLGVSTNLLTNIGRDWWAQSWGAIKVQNGPATATSATTLTGTGSTWTASNLASPELGNAGMRVYVPVTGLTTAPVYGNIVSNSTSVLTVDQWWNASDTTGTTPSSTAGFIIAPGGIAAARFVALTTNSGAANAADTTLTSEITTAGCGRALGTYAHTMGASTLTLTKAFSVTGTLTAVHKAGLFTCLTSAGADPMIYETVLNADATVANGDTLTLTWTLTLSG